MPTNLLQNQEKFWMKTLVIINPHAGSGRAGKLWETLEPLIRKELGEVMVGVTQRPDEIGPHLEKARAAGITRVIAIGGDGTNHTLVNEMVLLHQRYPDESPMAFGSLPIGTGQDWARSIGVPFEPEAAVPWIRDAQPVPLDIGNLTGVQGEDKHFLNIASVGISGVITSRINRLETRRPWTFYRKTLEAVVAYRPPVVKVKLDGKPWYEGKVYTVVVANGQSFGHGMKVAPNAIYNDNLFDVVLIEGMQPLKAAMGLNSIYSGAHLKRDDVRSGRAHTVEVEGDGTLLPLELDGEAYEGQTLIFEVIPGILNMLVKQA
jgi:diacylglycerol kinase (ATP)